MKIILSKDNVKREITTPFAMCMSMKELEIFTVKLRNQYIIMKQDGIAYGWFKIEDDLVDFIPANVEPKKWTE